MLSFIVGLRNALLHLSYKLIIKRIVFLYKPEDAHDKLKSMGKFLGATALGRGLTWLMFYYGHKSLNTTVDGIFYKNPVGLSAGFDKDGELTDIYPALSFGLAELGSFTGDVCPGNPGERLFRMKKTKSILVWYGLNNKGAEEISRRLANKKFHLPIGISAAKSNLCTDFVLEESIQDYLKTYNAFREIGDYYTINISCPNTQDGEPFADKDNLRALLERVNEVRVPDKPVYVKLAADLDIEEVNDILDVCLEQKIDGVVLTNLAKPHGEGKYEMKDPLPYHKGAMSGLPVQRIATDMIRHVYRYTGGRITIVGVGGIFTARDAYEKITSGANILHMITGMIFEGPQTMGEINRGLVKLLKKDGFSSIEEAVGSKNPLPGPLSGFRQASMIEAEKAAARRAENTAETEAEKHAAE